MKKFLRDGKMIIWGISAFSHDAAITVIKDDEIIFGAHAERYSRIKNDANLNQDIINECLTFGYPDKIYFYENPFKKKIRQLFAGQFKEVFSPLPSTRLKEFNILAPMQYIDHHTSHIAGSVYTSGFNECACISIDGIGEFETLTIQHFKDNKFTKIFSMNYPNSYGLWYSAMTQRLGLKPNEEEYILMGMAAYGKAIHIDSIMNDFFELNVMPEVKINLHRGCNNWREDLNTMQDKFDIAASVQAVYEKLFLDVLLFTKNNISCDNLILSGGSALNCKANTAALKHFKHVHILPNPGDAGSSLGCILAALKRYIPFSPFIGKDIPGEYPYKDIVDDLIKNKITAVASGRAEFGPRALGHRSILADPRGYDVKQRVNRIKKRDEFRPFAPMILEEHVHKYFDVPQDFKSPYMQFAVICKNPLEFPAVVHIDGTSRVQTVSKNDGDIYNLLKEFYDRTGCPMLLNTSLNIKGEPLVNSKEDAKRWKTKYHLNVHLPKS